MIRQSEERPVPHRPSPGAGDEAPVLQIMLVADTATPSRVRRRFRRWLDGLGWPRDHRDDIIVAVDEATANVVDHAYLGQRAGPIWIVARELAAGLRGHRHVEITVRDWGRWRPVPADPGFRGRGIAMMQAFMRRVDLRCRDDGTEIVLRSPAVQFSQ
ncbi:ATP-binding protein [Pseudonocardia sp. DLS-67]